MKSALSIACAWLSCLGACAAAPDLAGAWQGKFLMVRYTVHVVQREAEVHGVARVLPPFGEAWTYHVDGRVDGDRVAGRHHSGHRFEGKIDAAGLVSGVLTTRHGFKVRLTLRRQR